MTRLGWRDPAAEGGVAVAKFHHSLDLSFGIVSGD
jgi:hypothetical protein